MLDKLFSETIILPIVVVVGAILLYFVIKQVIMKMFRASSKFGVHKKSITIMKLIINVVKYFIIIVVSLTLLGIWGVDTKALLASLGIVGAVAGLAMQDILKDFLAGFAIIIDNEFDVGDNVKIGDFRGDVIELGMRNTKVRAYTGEVKSIANRNITDVINYSTQTVKCVVDICVSYDSDLEKVEKVLNGVCESLTKETSYLTSDVQLLGIEKFDDNAMVYRVVADCEPMMDFAFKRVVHKAVKLAFNENNLEIPLFQVVVHSES